MESDESVQALRDCIPSIDELRRDGKLYGCTEPRVFTPPARELTPETSLGFECIEFAQDALGIDLFPWQKWLLIHALELNEDGTFRFRKVVVLVARQNGKTTLFKVWALWRMYIDNAEAILGTAQDLTTAEKTWEQTYNLAASIPDLKAELGVKRLANGGKYFRLKSGNEYLTKAATGGAGRGASIELVFMDELREHKDYKSYSAVTKTTNAIPRAQVVMMSNAGDATSVVLNTLQDNATLRVEQGNTADTQTGIFEWSGYPDCDVWDRVGWAQANPSLGYGTITESIIASDCETDPEGVFRTEVLCQRVKVLERSIFTDEEGVDHWAKSAITYDDERGRFAEEVGPGVKLDAAVEVSHNRSNAYIVVSGKTPGGRILVEVAAQRGGTDWVVPWLKEHEDEIGRVAVQAKGAPASSLLDDLTAANKAARRKGRKDYWEVIEWGGADLAKAHGKFFDLVAKHVVGHLQQPILDAAAQFAKMKPLGDSWVFDRAKSPEDVAPLIGAVEAAWLLTRDNEVKRSAYEDEDAEVMVL